ncbi:MAG: aspartate 1-decarboxylase [Alphaproteobacteria bacterium]
MLYAKIHRARITKCELHYNGSMGIDEDYLDAAGLLPGQKIDVLNVNNGARISTYILKEPRGSKIFGIYGAAAHLFNKGDISIIIAYAEMDIKEAKSFKPTVLVLDENNEVIKEQHARRETHVAPDAREKTA